MDPWNCWEMENRLGLREEAWKELQMQEVKMPGGAGLGTQPGAKRTPAGKVFLQNPQMPTSHLPLAQW